ncbi:MAG: ribose-phosphate pyrophosphokinase [Pseudomonadota bacterium]|jgi:ribose-phosphate pyrophosphokinase|nr:ribose-phosphate pyrophosphokinase [Pseudomonadota bacterium]|tara:strand:+ start:999 stop:1955 length:957 start_codon:yes stop_codon:yes gene_type:complete
MSDFDRLKIFTGNSNIELAEKIAKKIGIPIGKSVVGRFSDGEIEVELHENVRGKDVFVIQSTSFPTNDNLMELLFLVDSLKRSSAARITAVIPYFGYSRQDRRARSMRVPISAKVVANLVSSVGTGRVLTIDLHSDQEQGFFDIPVDNIYASPILVSDIWKKKINNLTIVSPDTGGVVRARAIAKQLDTDRFAIVDKKREKANESEVMNVIGDVSDSTCVIVDDMVDTAGTLSKASVALKEKGAKKVLAYATHPVLSGKAIDNIENSEIDELVVTDTINLSDAAKASKRVRQLSVSHLLGESIIRVHTEESLSSLFTE